MSTGTPFRPTTVAELAERLAALEARLTRPAPVLDSLLTTRDLASRLGHKNTRTVDEWRRMGGGPKYVRAGRTAYYRPEDVDEWLMNHRYSKTKDEL